MQWNGWIEIIELQNGKIIMFFIEYNQTNPNQVSERHHFLFRSIDIWLNNKLKNKLFAYFNLNNN